MTDILVRPQELRRTAGQLRAAAQKIGKSLEIIDGQIRSLMGQSFMGNRADALQSHYVAKREALSRARDLVLSFATELETAATIFEKADSGNSPIHLPVSAGEFWGNKDWRPRFLPIWPFVPILPPHWRPRFLPIWPFGPILPPQWRPNPNHPIIPFKIGENTETPDWITKLLDRFYPNPELPPLISPNQIDIQPANPPTTGFDELLKQSPVPAPTEPAPQPVVQPTTPQPEVSSQNLDYSYDVPVKAQGSLYGNAACSPTSISMILDYYHNQNGANQAVSADQLIKMMDIGDGGKRGISLSNLTDELNDIGYNNVTQKVGANFTDLRSVVQDGPVIVTAGVKIGGSGTVGGEGARTLTGPGNTIHAMVVTGLSDQQVHVNDPWTGQGLDLPREEFEKMWTRGSSAYYSIRP